MNDSDKGTSGQDERSSVGANDEHERRRRERRERVIARHPRIGWLLLALAGAQAYEESPRDGADRAGRRRDGDGAPNEPS